MINVSRVTDLWTGICCCHPEVSPPCIPMGGFIIMSSTDMESSIFGDARTGDLVIGYCGHIGFIATGSISNVTNIKSKAFITSLVTGCTIGHIITGNPIHGTGY